MLLDSVRGWKLMTVQDCASKGPYSTQIGPFGNSIMAKEYMPSGVPVIRGVNVNHGRFLDDDFVFVSEGKADELTKYESYPGDVLLVHRGTLGKIGLMPRKRRYPRYVLGNSMLRVQCDESKLLPEYLYYWLSSPLGQEYLFSRISQVGVPALPSPLATLRQATLLVPPLSEQHGIVKVLGVLDDKIELNQQMNRTLEAIAKAIFKHWFVDFDFLDREGNQYKLSGGDMVFNEELNRDIPSDWRVGEFGELIDLTMGLSPKGESYNTRDEGKPLINGAADFLDGRVVPNKYTTSPTRMSNLGDLLFCIRGTIGNLTYADTEYCLGRGVAAITSRNEAYKEFVYFTLQMRLSLMVSQASGSVIVGLSKSDILAWKTVIPPESIANAFHSIAHPIFERKRVLQDEADSLSEIRDLLLPKMMSGKIRVHAEMN